MSSHENCGKCGNPTPDYDVDDYGSVTYLCERCRHEGGQKPMKRYHVAIDGLFTKTVRAANESDAFLKSDFDTCEYNREYRVSVYEALKSEPDYPNKAAEFSPDISRKPMATSTFTMEEWE